MPGDGIMERTSNFVAANLTNLFMYLWFVSQVSLMLSRAIQLVGMGVGLRNPARRPHMMFLGMTVVHFMAIHGPIGNPKYRIPMEPALIIFFSIGLCAIGEWYGARRAGRQSSPRC